eukprot:scaffold135673_cov142-Phaeocystis_antarctica.AAC.1
MAEACIAWVGHVAAHVVDARCHLRIGLAEPDAAAERRASQALTLEVAVALRVADGGHVAGRVRVHAVSDDVPRLRLDAVLGDELVANDIIRTLGGDRD